MQESNFDKSTLELLSKLKEKYENVGEDLNMHLEGILFSDFTNYWDYVGIDALLNLQKPITDYPDEMIFIVYHQITELYFKIILHELEQIGDLEPVNLKDFLRSITRVNNYYDQLIQSFHVLISGMEASQFVQFRKALTPASGFQSIQYRLIEVWSTSFINLVSKDYRHELGDYPSIEEMYEHLYWHEGAIDKATKKKTLTFVQFDKKYGRLIRRKGNELMDKNLWSKFYKLPLEDQKHETLIDQLKKYDLNANVFWPLAHYKYAAKFLIKGEKIEKSTGGTNWQKYLPPKYQKQTFFPELWTEHELQDWGKQWVEKEIFSLI